MKVTRIDAFDMNFEECAVSRKYKLSTSGMGEKRIYVGHDETLLDEFFDLDNIESFLLLKKDLQKYLIEAREEYFHPVQEYANDISQFYEENVKNTNLITNDIIKLHFTKKYDSQHRYYLNFRQDGYSSSNWDFLRNIALPRVTKLNFVKVRNVNNNKLYIYIKPSFFMDEREAEEKMDIEDLLAGNKQAVDNRRKGQAQWRRELLDIMPACVITKVTEDRILEACHIKPHSVSLYEGKNEELIDKNNGLIMTPTYHKLFDMGFISFNDNGSLLVSPFLSNMNKQRLNLEDNKLYRIPRECSKYLAYHRTYVYNQIPDLQL